MSAAKLPTGVEIQVLVSSISTQCTPNSTNNELRNGYPWTAFVGQNRNVDSGNDRLPMQDKSSIIANISVSSSESDSDSCTTSLATMEIIQDQPSTVSTLSTPSITPISPHIHTTENKNTDTNTNTNTYFNFNNTAETATTRSTTTSTTGSGNLIDSLSQIAIKFDVLFPFYRLSDKDCKNISLFVYDNLDKINKVFCVSKGRYLEAYVYYYGGKTVGKKLSFYNNDDPENEVSTWNDIIMDNDYCLRELKLIK